MATTAKDPIKLLADVADICARMSTLLDIIAHDSSIPKGYREAAAELVAKSDDIVGLT